MSVQSTNDDHLFLLRPKWPQWQRLTVRESVSPRRRIRHSWGSL